MYRRALLFPTRVALHDDTGVFTYGALYEAAAALSKDIAYQLVGYTGPQTISYMCGNDASHVVTQWAIWMNGHIAVPLTSLHPAELIKYFLADSSSKLLISSEQYENILKPISEEMTIPLIITKHHQDSQFLRKVAENGNEDVGMENSYYNETEAMLLYTSGTTSKPKGVVWDHRMLSVQIAALQSAWHYTGNDVVLHCLPLHHVHGQVNSLNASLASGARIRMLATFSPHNVWSRLLGMDNKDEPKITVFHGVPAMYARLAAEHEKMFGNKKTEEYVRSTLSTKMRLMCAGSASLPSKLYHKWEKISGHRLLERYGMTEIGMALSNPYRPVEGRTVDTVGLPLPGVKAQVAIISDDGEVLPLVTVETPEPESKICLNRLGITSSAELFVDSKDYNWKEPKITIHNKVDEDGEVFQGELLIKGPAVFTTYWNKCTKLTCDDFTADGWFRTGDTVSFSENKFRILGRTSIDIIKTAGYKVSALQVESAILENPAVSDVAVLGVANENMGEIIVAAVVFKPDSKLTLSEIKNYAGKKLAPYQLPRKLIVLDELPRNTMGKLDKKLIKEMILKKT